MWWPLLSLPVMAGSPRAEQQLQTDCTRENNWPTVDYTWKFDPIFVYSSYKKSPNFYHSITILYTIFLIVRFVKIVLIKNKQIKNKLWQSQRCQCGIWNVYDNFLLIVPYPCGKVGTRICMVWWSIMLQSPFEICIYLTDIDWLDK